MSIYNVQERWGLGAGVDPHFDARIGRMAAAAEEGGRRMGRASGYIELDGLAPCDDLEALFAALYGRAPLRASLMFILTGALGLHQPSQVWRTLRGLRYLTTDTACGVALPLHGFNPSRGTAQATDLAQVLQRLHEATQGRLKQATLIGVTVEFDFEIVAAQLAPLFAASADTAAARADARRLLQGGPAASGPVGASLARMAGARATAGQHLGLASVGNAQLPTAINHLRSGSVGPLADADYGTGRTGSNTIVGIVDFGCDFAHPSFRNGAKSRIRALWDQNDGAGGALPEVEIGEDRFPIGRGRVFTREAIEEALQPAPGDTRDPYERLGYDPHLNHCSEQVPGTPGGPPGAHGTFVMEVAAGGRRNGAAACGVAREADIVFVHVRRHQRRDGRRVLDMNDVVDAIAFVFHVADHAGMPCVVNLSLNTMSGPHDGDGWFERRLASLLRSGRAGPEVRGRAVVVAAGNLPPNAMHWQHVAGTVLPGARFEFVWTMAPQDRTRNAVEIWYVAEGAWLQVSLVPPEAGEAVIGPVQPGRAAELVVHGQVVGSLIGSRPMPAMRSNHVLKGGPDDDRVDGRHVILLQIDVHQSVAVQWKVLLEPAPGGAPVGVDVHAWLERDDDGPSGIFPHVPAATNTIADPDLGCTLGTLSCGTDAIVVGAYSSASSADTQWVHTGRGPSRDASDDKPDLAAPGHELLVMRSRPPADPKQACAFQSGTSLAAPFVTGTIACIYEARPHAALADVRAALVETARSWPGRPAGWSADVGHGRLDPAAALARFT